MNIERKEIDSVNAIIKLQIEKSDYAEAVDSSLRAYARKANIPGFRPGKVPMAHVKKMFGKAVLADEINKLISDSLYKYIKDNNLNILGEPLPNKEEQQAINFDTQESFEFSFDIALAPDFKVTLDKNVTTPYYEINVDDIEDERTKKLIELKKSQLKVSRALTAEEIESQNAQIEKTNELYKQQDLLKKSKQHI